MIDKIGVDTNVVNPEKADVEVLDNALLEGVVRYPGSGTLLDNENVFIFGHSSYLPVVHNLAYKAFNRLSELNLGDVIKLYSEKGEYLFKVTKLEIATADAALVEFGSGPKKKLILSTCDTFGKKSDRFVVEAEFIGNRLLIE
jgi:LPXTG-site transpeptidase (sortase) family protein